MTTTKTAQEASDNLLALVDELVTHRVNVITDSDWFTELVADAVKEALV